MANKTNTKHKLVNKLSKLFSPHGHNNLWVFSAGESVLFAGSFKLNFHTSRKKRKTGAHHGKIST